MELKILRSGRNLHGAVYKPPSFLTKLVAVLFKDPIHTGNNYSFSVN